MLAETHITGSCRIDKGTVYKNGEPLFENKGANLHNFLLSVYQHFQLSYPKFYKMDNLSKLGFLTAEILLKDSFKKDNYQPEEIGMVLANSNSSLDDDINYFNSVKADIASPSLFVYTLPNIVIGEICIRNRFKGEHAFFIQERFDSRFIEKHVSYLLDQDIFQACICGWVDVLDGDYKAVLFLVEKEKKEYSVLFSAENMDSIFNNS